MRCALLATALALAVCAPASAVTVTVGMEDFPESPESYTGCSPYGDSTCRLHKMQVNYAPGLGTAVIPYDGHVVATRLRANASQGELRLRFGHPEDGALWRSTGVSDPIPAAAFDGDPYELTTPVPVRKGDHIGVSARGASLNEGSHSLWAVVEEGSASDYAIVEDWSETGTISLDPYVGDHNLVMQVDVLVAPPVITSLTPTAGSGGTSVTITGDYLTDVNSVTFGGTDAVFTVKSPTSIVASAPAGLTGDVPVVVNGPGGASGAATFSYPSPAPPADTTAPVVESLLLAPKAFRASKGTTVVFRLSEAANVALRIQRARKGRRKGSRCVVARKRGRRCTRYSAAGSLQQAGLAGLNELALKTVGGRRLKRGRYRLTAIATDAAGNASSPVRKRFRVKR